jgi:hypothetical protein
VLETEILPEDVLVNCAVDETYIDAEVEIGAVKVGETVNTEDNVKTVVTVLSGVGRPLEVDVIQVEGVTRKVIVLSLLGNTLIDILEDRVVVALILDVNVI